MLGLNSRPAMGIPTHFYTLSKDLRPLLHLHHTISALIGMAYAMPCGERHMIVGRPILGNLGSVHLATWVIASLNTLSIRRCQIILPNFLNPAIKRRISRRTSASALITSTKTNALRRLVINSNSIRKVVHTFIIVFTRERANETTTLARVSRTKKNVVCIKFTH